MAQMISGKDLARLHLDLQVPLLLNAFLKRSETLSILDEDNLHEAFDDLTPLEALISIACCLQIIIPHLSHEPDMIEPLMTHSDCIIDDYAPHFMRHSFPVT